MFDCGEADGCNVGLGSSSTGSFKGLGVIGFVKLGGLGFPPPLGFGFAFPLGFGFSQIGFSVDGAAEICFETDGDSVATIAGRKVTGETDGNGAFDGGGGEVGGGDGSGLGQSLVQIALSLQ